MSTLQEFSVTSSDTLYIKQSFDECLRISFLYENSKNRLGLCHPSAFLLTISRDFIFLLLRTSSGIKWRVPTHLMIFSRTVSFSWAAMNLNMLLSAMSASSPGSEVTKYTLSAPVI